MSLSLLFYYDWFMICRHFKPMLFKSDKNSSLVSVTGNNMLKLIMKHHLSVKSKTTYRKVACSHRCCTCFSHDLHISVKNELILYVDNRVILVYDRDPNIISTKLAKDLRSCNEWFIDNKLSLNVWKPEYMLFGSNRKQRNVDKFEVLHYDKVNVGKTSVKYTRVVWGQDLSLRINVSLRPIQGWH